MPVEVIQRLPLTPAAPAGRAATLRLGQHFESIVQTGRGGLQLRLPGGQTAAIDPGHGLRAGQQVRVEVIDQGGAVALRITAAPPQAAPLSTPAVWQELLSQLKLVAQAHSAESIVPPALRANDAAARQLLQLFLQPGELSARLAQLQAQLTALDPGAGPLSEFLRNALQALGLFQLGQPGDLTGLLRRLREDSRLEARLAALAAAADEGGTEALPATLRGLIGSLRLHDELMAAARKAGMESELQSTLQGLEDRLLGGALQSARKGGFTYVFMEIPVPAGGDLDHFFLHVLSDASPQGRQGQAAMHRVVLDLSLTQLGPIWVELRSAGGAVECALRCRQPETVRIAHEARPALADALGRHFTQAVVIAGPWEESYLETVARLCASMDGMNLHA